MDDLFDFSDLAMDGEQTDTTSDAPENTDASGEAAEEAAADPESAISKGNNAEEGAGQTQSDKHPPEGADAQPAGLTFTHNHKETTLSYDEAVDYAQMGMKYESFKPTLEKLRFLAGTAGVEQLVDNLVSANEKFLYDKALEETGGNEAAARRLADLQIADMRRRYEHTKAAPAAAEEKSREDEKTALAGRLASGFIELQKETGDTFKTIKDVPPGILRLAASKGISLYDAWLRTERADGAKASAVKAKQEQAAARSAGAAGKGAANASDPGIDAFMHTFNEALG